MDEVAEMTGLLSDCRISARTLLKDRSFTFIVITTLALGIALAASVTAIVNGYLLRSLPYPAANRLYSIRFEPSQQIPDGLEQLNWQSLSNIIEIAIAWDLDMFYVTSADHPEPAAGAWVTPGFMQGLGIAAEVGRGFTDQEFGSGHPQVAMISHAFWRDRFGGDPDILGKQFRAYVSDRADEAETFTIVGVLPSNFWHVNPYTQVFAPLRAATYPYMIRLREGVPAGDAERRIGDLVRVPVHLRSVHSEYVQSIRPILFSIGLATAIVLVIAWANVALLILIRSNRQQRDVAIRFALGAGRGQVARTLITESLLLCVTAAIFGVLLATMLLTALGPVIQEQLGRPVPGGVSRLTIDFVVVSIVVVLTVILALGLSLVPLAASRRQSLMFIMRRGYTSGSGGTRARHIRSGLIVLEIAGTLPLLVGCGLMIQTLVREMNTDLGIQSDRLIAAGLALRERSYPDEATRLAFYDRLMNGLEQTAGIESIGVSDWPILAAPPLRRVDDTPSSVIGVTPDYFTTLGVTLKDGRFFTRADRAGSEDVAIVSETLARRLRPSGSAVGLSVRIVIGDGAPFTHSIVGVVSDVRQLPTDQELADLYIPLLQAPGRFSTVYLRVAGSQAWTPTLRTVVRDIDPEVSLRDVRDVRVMAGEQLIRPRFLTSLMTSFAIVALILALIGIYGVVAYNVKQREHEIAIRIAVGANAASVIRLFLRQGSVVIAGGLLLGTVGAGAIGRLLESQLYGVSPGDILTMMAMSTLIALAAIAANWLPARRASRTDPMLALRAE
jgi:putative ABC transport system permease protein